MAKRKVARKPATGRPGTKKKSSKQKASAAAANGSDYDSYAEGLNDAWDKARTATPGSGGPPNIPDGRYIGQLVSASMQRYKSGERKGKYYFLMRFAIHYCLVDGEELNAYEGTTVQSRDDLLADPCPWDESQTFMDIFSAKLSLIGYQDRSKINPKNFPTIAQELSKSQPMCSIQVANKHTSAEDSKDGKPHHNQNVYLNAGMLSKKEIKEMTA